MGELLMNKHLLKFAALVLSAVLPSACGIREEAGDELSVDGTVRFIASGDEAKTAFAPAEDGIYPCLWTGNNECVALSLNWGDKQVAAVEASEDGRSATFELSFDIPETEHYRFAAFSPASAVKSASSSRQAWSINLPVDQRPLETSADESAQLLSALSADYSAVPSKVRLGFSHVSAYGRLAISNLQNGDAAILGVELTCSVPFAGQWYYSPADGSLTDNGASSTIHLETTSVDDVWFACMPCEMTGQTLDISVLTEAGTFTKTISPRDGLAFLPGKIARISVDFSNIVATSSAEVFTLVTDISDLSVGDEVLIVNEDGTFALGEQRGTSSKPYRARAAVSVSNDTIEDAGTATVLTLGQGNSNDSWSLMAGSAYLCNKSSGNYLTTSTTINDNSSWTISRSGGTTTIKAKSGESQYIKYNGASNAQRFSCYKGTTTTVQNICIFKKGGSGGAPAQEDPLLEHSQYGLDLGGMQRFYTAGPEQYARSYNEAGIQTFVLLHPGDKEQLEITGYNPAMRKGDSVSFSISWRKGLSTIFNGSWTLTLIREDGPKVWLSDGKGGGVIIKK